EHQLEMRVLALRANLAHVAEGEQGQGNFFTVEVIDDDQRIELAKNQRIDAFVLAAAGLGWWGGLFRRLKIHRSDSLSWLALVASAGGVSGPFSDLRGFALAARELHHSQNRSA